MKCQSPLGFSSRKKKQMHNDVSFYLFWTDSVMQVSKEWGNILPAGNFGKLF